MHRATNSWNMSLLPRYSAVAFITPAGSVNPSRSQSTAPRTSHARMPWCSARSFIMSDLSRFSTGTTVVNGTSRIRRQTASVSSPMSGLLFVARMSLWVRLNSKKSCRMNRPLSRALPVSRFTSWTRSRAYRSVSDATTSRRPIRSAMSVGWSDPVWPVRSSGGASVA